MAKKDKQGRVIIEDTILKTGRLFYEVSPVVFVSTKSGQVLIMSKTTLDKLESSGLFSKSEPCTIQKVKNKNYITIPNSIDELLGPGKDYVFSFDFNNSFPHPIVNIKKM